MPTPEEITRHHQTPHDDSFWVLGRPAPEPVHVVGYDPQWPEWYARAAALVRAALGDRALQVEHVGSTSVTGLSAKPVIDADLTVTDPADEDSYVPALERRGFVLTLREPPWHEHRMLTLREPRTNLHVFGPDCPELIRHRMFRDWLARNPEDLARYREAKLEAAVATTEKGGIVVAYNRHKEPVLQEIYARMFAAHGLSDTRDRKREREQGQPGRH